IDAVVLGVNPKLAKAGVSFAATARAAINDDVDRALDEGGLRPRLWDEAETDGDGQLIAFGANCRCHSSGDNTTSLVGSLAGLEMMCISISVRSARWPIIFAM